MHIPTLFITVLLTLLATSTPLHLTPRGNTPIDPNSITGTTCTSTNSAGLVSHDTNVAILSICGGIAGTIQKCGGAPTSTTGTSGTSSFALQALNSGSTIVVSKGRWEHCVAAARAACPGTFTSTCIGGTSDGKGFTFTLSHT